MGICWGTPDFPTPSSRPAFHHGSDLALSSTTSGTTSSAAVSNNASSAAASDNSRSLDRAPASARELKVFEYGELRALTKNFACALSDCRDRIYRGWLVEKKSELAVHLLELPSNPSRMQSSITDAKIQLFGSISHPNLAPLLGYCLNHREMLLVYESSEDSTSLEAHLFNNPADAQLGRKDELPPLSWDRRVKIATEASQGLAILHLSDVVFLTYFQASSIILDKAFGVKIVGFNFLITNPKASERIVTKTTVEFNERLETEHQRRQDIYDYGVFLLEILTGLPLGQNRWLPEYSLRIDWIKRRIQSRDGLPILMDSRLEVYPHDAAFEVAQVAVQCLESDPLRRPNIGQVLQALNQIEESLESSQFAPVRFLDPHGRDKHTGGV